MSLRHSKNWDQQLEFNLPDSRLSQNTRDDNIVYYARMHWEKVFCANCGVYGGLVTARQFPHVFYVCEKCVDKCGDPPGTIEVTLPDGHYAPNK